MIYSRYGLVVTMSRSEAIRIVRSMLRRSKDIESPDYDLFTQPQYTALQVLLTRRESKFQTEEE